MSYKVYARHGGAVAASLDDITDRVPAFDGPGNLPLIRLTQSFQNGAASQGTMIVPDPVGNMDDSLYFPPRTQITWTEDASGDELWLAQGRVSAYSIGRGVAKAAANVQWSMTIDDCNRDLDGLAFTEDWVRPAETGTARLYALALYTLNGTSSTRPNLFSSITYRPSTTIIAAADHLAPDSNTVDMPAKTYPIDTQPREVITDIATTEGKVFGVVPHDVGGATHKCIRYHLETDHSVAPSPCKISDVIADWDDEDLTAPVFEPIYDQGDAQRVDGNAFASGIVNRWGSGSDQIQILLDTISADATEYWVESIQDGDSTTADEAFNRAAAVVAYRIPYAETDSVSIIALPEQIHLLRAGMSLQVKAAPINTSNDSTIGSYLDRRIASVEWSPLPDGRYHGALELNKTMRAVGGGALQPVSTTPRPAPQCAVADPGGIGAPVAGIAVFCDTGEGNTVASDCGGIAASDLRCSTGSLEGTTPYSAISPGTYYSEIQVAHKYGGDGISIYLKARVNDSSAVLPNIVTLIDIATLAECRHGADWHTLSGTFTVPAGYNRVSFLAKSTSDRSILEGSHLVNEYTPPASEPENDPDCIPGGPGDSPYYMKTDDPRFVTLQNEVASMAETWAIAWKRPVRAATTTAGTLASSFEDGDVVDGVTLATGDRILIKDQAAGATNGIYTVNATGAPTRAVDFDSDEEAFGAATFVSEGTANGNKVFVCTTNEPITLDTTALVFAGIAASSGTASELITSEVEVYSAADANCLNIRPVDNNTYARLLIHPKGIAATGDSAIHLYYSRTSEGAASELFLGIGANHGASQYLVASGDANAGGGYLPIHFMMEDGVTQLSVMRLNANRSVEFWKHLILKEIAAPGTPASGDGVLYEKTDGLLYFKNDAGTEYDLTSQAGALDDLSDVIITSVTAGDILRHNGSAFVNVDEQAAGHWEVIVSGTAPPVAVTNEAADDWVYGWVSG